MTAKSTKAAAVLRRHLSMLKLGTGAAVIAAAAAWSVPAVAQETTSSIRGIIVTPDGADPTGVDIQITHVPSGTTSSAAVNAEGRFSAAGLRVGGPYLMTVTGPGYKTFKIEDVFIQLGQPFFLAVPLEANEAATVEEVVITGERLRELTIGVGSQFDSRQIANAASTTRDLKDVIRNDPKVSLDPTNSGAITIAGSNNRFNSLTVDGVKQNDDFGLNAGGYPTQRVPISLDAIDQLSVLTAPYDVEYSGFTGGTVNVVTKSGTNEFHGSAYYYYSDQDLAGDKSGSRSNLLSDFKDKTYGGSLGGPIIQDTLFFFFNYEKYKSASSVAFGPEGSGAGQTVRGITQAEVDQVTQIAQSVYGYNTLGAPQPAPETDEKYLGKIDWNVTDEHRVSFAYQHAKGNNFVGSSGNTQYGFESNSYDRTQKMNSYSLQVFSDWTENLSTELKLGYKEVDSLRPTKAPLDFASIRITDNGGSFFVFGPELSSHSNVLKTDTLSSKAKAEYRAGDHTLTAGWERDDYDYYNLFVQRSLGEYRFNSIADFQNRTAAAFIYNSGAGTNNPLDAAAEFSYQVNSFYIQDDWQAVENLTLTAGLRYEYYSSSDKPRLNQNFVNRYGFENTETLDDRDLWLPRLGVNYRVQPGTTLRGGAGLFSALGPAVWVSNNFSNNGVSQVGLNLTRNAQTQNNPLLNNVDPRSSVLVPAAGAQLAGTADAAVNAMDPNFEVPSTWRFSIGMDQVADLGFFGDEWLFSLDAIYSEVKQAITYRDLRLTRTGTAPDGRPIYASRADGRPGIGTSSDLLITNTDKGGGLVLSLGAQKSWQTEDFGTFDFSGGYAYQDIREVHPLTSSVASSNFEQLPLIDPNDPANADSSYEVRHRFAGNFTWTKAFFGDYNTSFSFFVESREGRPFSYTFRCSSTVNPVGDPACSNGTRSRQLFYVPAGPADPNVTYAAGLNYEVLRAYLERNGLQKYAGQIAPRNGFQNPWVNTIDLHVEQEIPGLFEGHKGVFTFDIKNLGNMIDSDWGRLEQVPFSPNGNAVDVLEARLVNGVYQYSLGSAGLRDPNYSINMPTSVWRVQVGVRYQF
ncbi:MAG TPA: TonB-dependent receptor [Azospirillaceae bacterium]|nr:TonB-dependent receptor [Azospirillaceae bacterium]